MALAQSDRLDSPPPDVPSPVTLFPLSHAQIDGIQKDFGQPTKRSFSMDLGPKFIELQALYLEISLPPNPSARANSHTALWDMRRCLINSRSCRAWG